MASLKGQETSINVVSTTQGLLTSFLDVKEFTITFDRTTLSEGYLGQTTEKKDSVFNGVSFKGSLNTDNPDFLAFIQRVNEVTRGRLPGESIQIVTTLRFAFGTRRVIIPNCQFGNLEIGIGGRAEYVSFPIEGVADDATILAA